MAGKTRPGHNGRGAVDNAALFTVGARLWT